MFSNELHNLIESLAKLPGLGPRSAQRIALHLISNKPKMRKLAQSLAQAEQNVGQCQVCGNFDTCNPCTICNDTGRPRNILCIVETVSDLWAMERTRCFKGLYHVLGGALSALDGVFPEHLLIEQLWQRLRDNLALPPEQRITEAVLCLNPNLAGQTTANYLAEGLRQFELNISALAKGVPLDSEVKYVDDGTLIAAWHSRVAV